MSIAKVVLAWQAEQDEVQFFREALPKATQVVCSRKVSHVDRHLCDIDELLEIAAEAQVIAGWIIPREVIERCDSLEFVQPFHAGVDHIDLDLLRRRGIMLANVSGANSIAVAEHALALVLATCKNVIRNNELALKAEPIPFWSKGHESVQLANKTLCVLGLGRIGSHVARLADAFGMRVVGVRRDSSNIPEGVDAIYPPELIDEALSLSDIIVVCLPLTSKTERILNETRFQAMNRCPVLVNVGRAEVISEKALAGALDTHQIRAFASDVWWAYPRGMPGTYYAYPSVEGIHTRPNVVVSPDMAGNTMEVRKAMLEIAASNIAAYLRGETVPHLVDLAEGY